MSVVGRDFEYAWFDDVAVDAPMEKAGQQGNHEFYLLSFLVLVK